MRDGFDQRHVGFEHVFQHVLGVAGGADSEHLQRRALRFDLLAQRREHVDGVLDRIAVGKLVRLAEHIAGIGEQHGFGGSRAAVDADESSDHRAGRKGRALEPGDRVLLLEFPSSSSDALSPAAAGLCFLRLPAYRDVVFQTLGADVNADVGVFILAELDCAECRKVLRVLRNLDQIFRLRAFRNFDLALFPHPGDVLLPSLFHAANEAVRAAQQQHMRTQCVSACEHRQVLQHDGIKQRSHQLIRRNALLLQAVDIGLGEHAALAGNRMQLDSGVTLIAQVLGRNLQLGVDLVDDRARTAGALVIHRRNFLLAPGILVLFEDDDLRVLTAQLDHRVHFRMQLLDRQRDRRNFLHKLRADQIGQRAAARAGDEDAAVVRRNAGFVLHALQELERLFRLLGLVALIVAAR